MLALLFLMGLVLAGIVFAQSTAPAAVTLSFDNFKAAASNPLIFIGIIISVVADLRGAFKVDGKIAVIIFAIGVGAAIGVVYQLTGLLAVDPFSTYSMPFGGIAYGGLGGLGAYLGVNLYDLLSLRHATNVAAASTTANAAATGGGTGNSSPSPEPSSPPSG